MALEVEVPEGGGDIAGKPGVAAAYRMAVEDVGRALEVDIQQGLSAAEAGQRLSKYGANRLSEKEKESGWKAFLRQYRDLIQIVLLGAAVINQIATSDTGTTLVLAALNYFNAVLGLDQGARTRAALAA